MFTLKGRRIDPVALHQLSANPFQDLIFQNTALRANGAGGGKVAAVTGEENPGKTKLLPAEEKCLMKLAAA